MPLLMTKCVDASVCLSMNVWQCSNSCWRQQFMQWSRDMNRLTLRKSCQGMVDDVLAPDWGCTLSLRMERRKQLTLNSTMTINPSIQQISFSLPLNQSKSGKQPTTNWITKNVTIDRSKHTHTHSSSKPGEDSTQVFKVYLYLRKRRATSIKGVRIKSINHHHLASPDSTSSKLLPEAKLP